MKKTTLLASAISIVFVVGFLTAQEKNHDVLLTEKGFTPKSLIIHVGDTVTFSSNRGVPFWPASNLHPSHEIYADFDPKHPIAPRERWQFTFQRPGLWEYHDHLFPLFTGTIRVQDKKDKPAHIPCPSGADTTDLSCILKYVRTIVEDKGTLAGLEGIENLYNTSTIASESCHSLAHVVGQAGYGEFVSGQPFSYTEKAAICNFGFYHGFMEALIQDKQDIVYAKKFCDQVATALGNSSPDAGNQCFHGIGHGAVGSIHPEDWGDDRAMAHSAIVLCETVTREKEELFRCASGAYNGLAAFYLENEYGLTVDSDDPMSLCRSQPSRYKDACYTNLMPTLYIGRDRDFDSAYRYIVRTVEKEHLLSAVETLATYVGVDNTITRQHEKALRWCKTLPTEIIMRCAVGYIRGLLNNSVLTDEYKEVLHVCTSDYFNTEEQGVCLHEAFRIFKDLYADRKIQEICHEFAGSLKLYCGAYVNESSD